jgi:RsiW-degrading membrane proteinase PrsW (M82 family)
MIQIAGFALSVLIPLAVLVLIHRSGHCPQPRRSLRMTAWLCAGTALLTAIASAAIVMAHGLTAGGSVVQAAAVTWQLLPILALLEEISRFVVLRFYSLRREPARSLRDGIVYGLAAGLVFALLENIMTFGGPGAGSAASGWLRVALATPLHTLLGGLMGYLLVRWRGAGLRGTLAALLAPTAIHFVYDAPVILAVAKSGMDLTVEVAVAAVSVSAAIVVALAWTVFRLFRRAGPEAWPRRS